MLGVNTTAFDLSSLSNHFFTLAKSLKFDDIFWSACLCEWTSDLEFVLSSGTWIGCYFHFAQPSLVICSGIFPSILSTIPSWVILFPIMVAIASDVQLELARVYQLISCPYNFSGGTLFRTIPFHGHQHAQNLSVPWVRCKFDIWQFCEQAKWYGLHVTWVPYLHCCHITDIPGKSGDSGYSEWYTL
jgi:hypothetical protein